VSEQAIRDGVKTRCCRGVSDNQRCSAVILDVAHNPHAAAYLAGRLKTLSKTGRVLAVIGMLHDKDIAGTLANLQAEVDDWYCAPLEGPRGARRSSCWNICAQVKSILAWLRRGMPRWRTPDLKIRCWCVVHSIRWRM
jgi:folylpolyglutamate synthase/dihydropteroate synthase